MAKKRPFQSEAAFGLEQMRKRASYGLAHNKFGKTEPEKRRETEAAFQKGAQEVGDAATQINAAGLGQGIVGGQGSRALTGMGSQLGGLAVQARTGVQAASDELAFKQRKDAERMAKEAEAERMAKRARVLGTVAKVGGALLMPGTKQIGTGLAALSGQQAPGSKSQKVLGALGDYAQNVHEYYKPREKTSSGGTSGT